MWVEKGEWNVGPITNYGMFQPGLLKWDTKSSQPGLLKWDGGSIIFSWIEEVQKNNNHDGKIRTILFSLCSFAIIACD